MATQANYLGPKTIVGILILIGGGFALGLYAHSFILPGVEHKANVKPPPLVKAPSKVTALGRIQPNTGLITVGFPLPDRLKELRVEEGSMVKDDQAILAVLESQKERELELELITQQIKEAEDKIRLVKKSGAAQLELEKLKMEQVQQLGPLDLEMQKLKVELLKKQAQYARANLDKVKHLRGQTVSQQEFDQQEVLAMQTEKELEGALAQKLKLARSQELEKRLYECQYAVAEAAKERTESEISLNGLKKQKDLAKARLERTIIRAPSKGKVLKLFCRPGELVGGQQPLLQMADTDKMAVVAEVHEHDIHRVKIGAEARISRGAAKVENLKGKVIHVGGMIAKNRVFAADPTADVDLRVIDVKILLDDGQQAAGLINHQVTVEIQAAPEKVPVPPQS